MCIAIRLDCSDQPKNVLEKIAYSTDKLISTIDHSEIAIVDIRPSHAYNGWRLKGEARGGHIRGAVNLPLSWIGDLTKTALKSILISKRIPSKKAVVVYGYEQQNCSTMADLLMKFDINNVFIVESGFQDWAAEASLPIDNLTNYQNLVYADWLEGLISGTRQENFTLIEVSWGGYPHYEAGHIPGAIHFDLSTIEDPTSHNICPDEDLMDFLLAHGITSKSPVILYGRDPMATARSALIMMYAGVEEVRILDGGFDAWVKAGHALDVRVQQPIPAESFGKAIPTHPEYFISIEAAKDLLADDHSMLVSVRSWNEFIGETSGYDFIKAKGRVAGAVWGRAGSDPYHMQDYRNFDNTMRSYHEITSNWQTAGITPRKNIAFYCGTGWRASEAFLYAFLMGWPNISIFDGGWFQWSLDEANPIERGMP